MNYKTCPKCGSRNTGVIANGRDYHHKRKCKSCGQVYKVMNRRYGQSEPRIVMMDDEPDCFPMFLPEPIADSDYGFDGGSAGGGGASRSWDDDSSFDIGDSGGFDSGSDF